MILVTWTIFDLCLSSKWCFRTINVWMVEGWRLAWCKEIVSQPPEKMHSTATAEPGMIRQFSLQKKTKGKKLTRNWENITSKSISIWELGMMTYPPLDRVAWIKIISWNLKILLQLIDINPLLLILSHKINWSCWLGRKRWQSGGCCSCSTTSGVVISLVGLVMVLERTQINQ